MERRGVDSPWQSPCPYARQTVVEISILDLFAVKISPPPSVATPVTWPCGPCSGDRTPPSYCFGGR